MKRGRGRSILDLLGCHVHPSGNVEGHEQDVQHEEHVAYVQHQLEKPYFRLEREGLTGFRAAGGHTKDYVYIANVNSLVLPRVVTLKVNCVKDVLQENIHSHREHDSKLGHKYSGERKEI